MQTPAAAQPASALAATSASVKAEAGAALAEAPADVSQTASAAASAEAAKVKGLEAKLAEFQAQSSQLQAQNMRLTSELEKAQHLSQESLRMASLVRPPPAWQAHIPGQTLLYIDLPIPELAEQAQEGDISDAELKTQHKAWFNDMRTNEVDMNDALAALRWLTHTPHGHVDRAGYVILSRRHVKQVAMNSQPHAYAFLSQLWHNDVLCACLLWSNASYEPVYAMSNIRLRRARVVQVVLLLSRQPDAANLLNCCLSICKSCPTQSRV